MIKFINALNAWNGPDFNSVLKMEVEALSVTQLPLQQGLSQGSYASHDKFDVMVLGVTEEHDVIRAKAGIFYHSVIAGCNCADDPTPVDEQNEYCEVLFEIDKATAETTVTLISA